MKICAPPLYSSSFQNLMRDNSAVLENLFYEFGLLFFSIIAKYIQETYNDCHVEFYKGGYVKITPPSGLALEAYKENGLCYFQYCNGLQQGSYFIKYSGRSTYLQRSNEVIPMDPNGIIYFHKLEAAKEVFDGMKLNAILYEAHSTPKKIFAKVMGDK
ncbi:MAG TPA: hypothetical protein VFQ73_03905 [Flavisolibacter sp.]|nr:hypothetical protein [Flavisolibacter sp.]